MDRGEIQRKIDEISEQWVFKIFSKQSKSALEAQIKHQLAAYGVAVSEVLWGEGDYGMVANVVIEEPEPMDQELPDEIVMLLDRHGIDQDAVWAVKFYFSQETGFCELEVKMSPAEPWMPISLR